MNRSQLIWTIVFALGALGLLASAMRGAGAMYVEETTTIYRQYDHPREDDAAESDAARPVWKGFRAEVVQAGHAEALAAGLTPTGAPDHAITTTQRVDPVLSNQPNVRFSWVHTIGVWIAGLLTLCVLSFLWGDNVFYKVAESIVIGSSAAYVMVAAFWPMLVERLMGNIVPGAIAAWSNPGLSGAEPNYIYLLPFILCILLLWRLAPRGGWIARWPLAFFIGATAGFRLIGHLEADFIVQIRAAIVPLWVKNANGQFDLWMSLTNIIMTVGVLSTLTYFFFSVEHKGVVGKTARLGIWFLMITFGVGFGLTVMGRIALIAERFQFLVDDWLWIIDPTGKRALEVVSMLTSGVL